MAKPLHLFIRPPYDDWTLVNNYGPDPFHPQPAQPVFHHYPVLQTTGAGELFAAIQGKLSINPPGTAKQLSPDLGLPAFTVATPRWVAVTLYLHTSPEVAARLSRFYAGILPVRGFVYLNVDTSSLEGALGPLLDQATVPPVSKAEVVERLIAGELDVHVPSGHPIGVASFEGAPAGSRQVGFAALSPLGPIPPADAYDWYRDFIEDGQQDLDALLALVPPRWPVIDGDLTTADAINKTELNLYPMSVLDDLRISRNLSAAQWREVGDNQKNIWLRRLRQRIGHPVAGSDDPPFEFNDLDWQNTFQLEAVVELYANYNDPWAAGAVPRNPGDPHYATIDFLDLEGVAAMVAGGNVVTLDLAPDLTRVVPNHDTIFLEEDTARASKTYLIKSVNDAADTVTLDASPAFAAGVVSSAWRINYRPVIVIIDPFGGRLNGKEATSPSPGVLLLDDPIPDLSRVNPHFDTIYLPSDTANPKRTYRITSVDNGAHTVTVDGHPILDGDSSTWHIPAGISGEKPALNYNFKNLHGSGYDAGHDHFDGVVFVVKNGQVQGRFCWSSYTSRKYIARSLGNFKGANATADKNPSHNRQFTSSIRGNASYEVRSYRSPKKDFINYAFRVDDPGVNGVREARLYFGEINLNPPPGNFIPAHTADDSTSSAPMQYGGGKTGIVLHHSVDKGHGNSSQGCLVSPSFVDFRTLMIQLQQHDHTAVNGAADPNANRLVGINHARGKIIWSNTRSGIGGVANQLAGAAWRDWIKATLWLIRPDERPL